jgi:hypothetical protein
MKKTSKTSTAEKPIVLTVTILPLKGKKRPVIISGAPQGEMPIIKSGVFQEMQALIFSIYGQIVNREPQTVTLKESKSAKTKTNKTRAAEPYKDKVSSTQAWANGHSGLAEPAASELAGETETETGSDQLVTEAPAADSPAAGQLPLIAGDETEDNHG